MRECPKCSSQYGDDAKICRTCGAILEAVAEKPSPGVEDNAPPHEEDNPHEAASVRQHSWTCSQCGQSVPPSFEVCWNCGTSQDGVPDPDFSKEPVSNDGPSTRQKQGTAAERIDRLCPKCGSAKIIPGTRILDQGQYSDGKLQVVVDGDPDALIFKNRLYDQLTADICGECGHVELTVERPKELYEHYLRSQE
jgi:RNA polymerase subunit RPABC4/transcription elongation factor Spt4